jgi:hypothetical protein
MDTERQNRWLPWLLVAGFILSLGIALLFTYRAVRAMARLGASEEIRPWMTLPYIAHARHVPVTDLYQALGIPYQVHDSHPISRIARLKGVPVQVIIEKLNAAIQKHNTPGLPTPTHAPPGAALVVP